MATGVTLSPERFDAFKPLVWHDEATCADCMPGHLLLICFPQWNEEQLPVTVTVRYQ